MNTPGNGNSNRIVVNSGLEPGLSREESRVLTARLPVCATAEEMEHHWTSNQAVIHQLLLRMGRENSLVASALRTPFVWDRDSFGIRFALMGFACRYSMHLLTNIREYSPRTILELFGGQCMLMELSAAAGYRTFCFPALVRGLLKSGKMRYKSSARMFDTFEFLNTMVQFPMNHRHTLKQLENTNKLHARYKVAGSANAEERELFKYIALNMFYIGPRLRHDLTPQERNAICGQTALVAQRMGHRIEGSVLELEEFIDRYEREEMFATDEDSALRREAIKIAQASQTALTKVPTVSKPRIHGLVPYRVKKLLEID